MTDHPLIEPLTKRIEELERAVADLKLKLELNDKRLDCIEKELGERTLSRWKPYKEGTPS